DLDKSSVQSWAPLKLTSIFPGEAVLQALRSDSIVQKALGADSHAKTLESVIDELQDATTKVKDCEFTFPPEMLENFALFDVKGDSALVRISLPPEAEVCRGQIAQLGLTLGPPLRGKEWFSSAGQRRDGFLMADESRLPKPAQTTFSFPRKQH